VVSQLSLQDTEGTGEIIFARVDGSDHPLKVAVEDEFYIVSYRTASGKPTQQGFLTDDTGRKIQRDQFASLSGVANGWYYVDGIKQYYPMRQSFQFGFEFYFDSPNEELSIWLSEIGNYETALRIESLKERYKREGAPVEKNVVTYLLEKIGKLNEPNEQINQINQSFGMFSRFLIFNNFSAGFFYDCLWIASPTGNNIVDYIFKSFGNRGIDVREVELMEIPGG